MSAALVSFRSQVLAWGDAPDDERLFQRVTRAVLGATVLLCLLLLWSPRPQEDRTQPAALPPRLAKLLLEHEPPPKPEPKPPVADPAKPEVAKPEAPAKAELKLPPVTRTEPVQRRPEPREAARDEPDARAPVADKPPGEIEAARRKVAGMGLLAARDDIAQAREAPAAAQLRTDIQPGKGVGSGKGAGVGAGNESGVPSRALITSNATGGSGGINTAGLSRNTGGGGLAGRATTLVDGATGGGGAGGSVKRGNSGKASRSLEDIKLVFERNKGAIYAIYNRALREDPSLQGKVVVELKISPAGSVTEARVVSSELHAPELEAKLLARIRQFDFGTKEVDQMNVTWPVDFLPS